MLFAKALLSLALLRGAFAYLDPGSTSFIFQILIAGLMGFLLVLRIFWTRIAGFFRRSAPPEEEQDQDAEQ
jgi:hypothetical protein